MTSLLHLDSLIVRVLFTLLAWWAVTSFAQQHPPLRDRSLGGDLAAHRKERAPSARLGRRVRGSDYTSSTSSSPNTRTSSSRNSNNIFNEQQRHRSTQFQRVSPKSRCSLLDTGARGGAAGIAKNKKGGCNGHGGTSGNVLEMRTYDYLNFITYAEFDTDDGRMEGSGTPEEAAANYLIYDDQSQVLLGGIPSAVEQRYAVLTLWFSSVHPWANETGWLSNESECTWYGIACDNVTEKVTSIDFQGNNYVGHIPPDIALLSEELNNATFDSAILAGSSIPSSVGQLTKMVGFSVNDCGLSGTIPSTMTQWTDLEILLLQGNNLTGTFPNQIGTAWTNLEYITTNGNVMLTGTISENISQWSNLRLLSFTDCDFTGTIPRLISQWSNIEHFHLSGNRRMEGPLPDFDFWTQAQTVSFLNMHGLTGTIPSSVNQMTSLYSFVLGNNAFTGPLPTDFSNLSLMDTMTLHNNMLTGTLPDSLGAMTNLRQFYIFRNLLTGPIPTSISAWANTIAIVSFENNFLTGSFPEAICNSPLLLEARVDRLEVSCTCCSCCLLS